MKYLLLSIILLVQFNCFAQPNDKKSVPLDTLNNIIFGSYPEIYRSTFAALNDSLTIAYPNRAHVKFTNLSDAKRDSMVSINWRKFKEDFDKSVDYDELQINRKTKSFFFTLYFDALGEIKYVLYSWNKYPAHNEAFNNAFKNFVSTFDYSGFPAGAAYSQCGTFVYIKGYPKH